MGAAGEAARDEALGVWEGKDGVDGAFPSWDADGVVDTWLCVAEGSWVGGTSSSSDDSSCIIC